MKKLFSIAVAMVMIMTFVPAALADGPAVTYSGAAADASELEVGDTFYWTFNVSAGSAMFSGHWLLDYDEDYLAVDAISKTWSGGIISAINASIDDGAQASDMPEFVYNAEYVGGTGQFPYGEDGNVYINLGMFLTSFSFGGMQMGGSAIRVQFRVTALPDDDLLGHDADGYYLSIPIEVIESTYLSPTTVEDQPSFEGLPHETVNVVDGKIYVSPTFEVTFHNTDGSVIETQNVSMGDTAVAPEMPEFISDPEGDYRFFGWDSELSNITGDMDVYPVYCMIGDVNGDGAVDSVDSMLAMRIALGFIVATDIQGFAADVDFDDSVTSVDSMLILRRSIGFIDSFLD